MKSKREKREEDLANVFKITVKNLSYLKMQWSTESMLINSHLTEGELIMQQWGFLGALETSPAYDNPVFVDQFRARKRRRCRSTAGIT